MNAFQLLESRRGSSEQPFRELYRLSLGGKIGSSWLRSRGFARHQERSGRLGPRSEAGAHARIRPRTPIVKPFRIRFHVVFLWFSFISSTKRPGAGPSARLWFEGLRLELLSVLLLESTRSLDPMAAACAGTGSAMTQALKAKTKTREPSKPKA